MAISLSSQTLTRTTTAAANYSSRLLKSVNAVVPLLTPTPTTIAAAGSYSFYYSSHPHFSIASLLPDVADSSSSPSSSSISPELEALAVRIIEDAVHRIIVNRSAPEWLPLVPGASYWVPPKRRNYGVAQLLRKLSNSPLPLTFPPLHHYDPEQLMSLTTSRGWPSSAYYLPNNQRTNANGRDDLSSEQTEVEETSCDSSFSEDQEG